MFKVGDIVENIPFPEVVVKVTYVLDNNEQFVGKDKVSEKVYYVEEFKLKPKKKIKKYLYAYVTKFGEWAVTQKSYSNDKEFLDYTGNIVNYEKIEKSAIEVDDE